MRRSVKWLTVIRTMEPEGPVLPRIEPVEEYNRKAIANRDRGSGAEWLRVSDTLFEPPEREERGVDLPSSDEEEE